MAGRATRSRYLWPLTVSAILFALYGFLGQNPRMARPYEPLLGPHLRLLLFAGYVPLVLRKRMSDVGCRMSRKRMSDFGCRKR